MLQPFLCWNNERVFDNCRTLAYIENGIAHPNKKVTSKTGECSDCCCEEWNVDEDGNPLVYTTPENDNAVWWVPERPESGQFAGPLIRSFTTSSVRKRVGGNDFRSGRLVNTKRQFRIVLELVTKSVAATAFACEWIEAIFDGQCSDCGTADGAVYKFCGEEGQRFLKGLNFVSSEVLSSSDPSDSNYKAGCRGAVVEIILEAEDPNFYGCPVDCCSPDAITTCVPDVQMWNFTPTVKTFVGGSGGIYTLSYTFPNSTEADDFETMVAASMEPYTRGIKTGPGPAWNLHNGHYESTNRISPTIVEFQARPEGAMQETIPDECGWTEPDYVTQGATYEAIFAGLAPNTPLTAEDFAITLNIFDVNIEGCLNAQTWDLDNCICNLDWYKPPNCEPCEEKSPFKTPPDECKQPELPPAPPPIAISDCFCWPWAIATQSCLTESISEYAKGKLIINVFAGSTAMRNLRIRIFPYYNQPDPAVFREGLECVTPEAEALIGWIGKNETLIVDGQRETVEIQTLAGDCRPADELIFREGGQIWDHPILDCSQRYWVVADADCFKTAPDATFSVQIVPYETS